MDHCDFGHQKHREAPFQPKFLWILGAMGIVLTLMWPKLHAAKSLIQNHSFRVHPDRDWPTPI